MFQQIQLQVLRRATSRHGLQLNSLRLLHHESQGESNHEELKRTHGENPMGTYEQYYEKHHISTNTFQKTLLGIGSGIMALYDPYRGDMIACMGETTGYSAIQFIKQILENSDEGQEILRERPRINSKTVNLDKLKQMPIGTFGRMYSDFLIANNVTPDARLPVQFVDDIESAYVMQRYREVHDLFHAVLEMPTNMLGECTVKWVEAIQTRLPMCITGALFGGMRLKPKHRELYIKYHRPWAVDTGYTLKNLMTIYYEKRWEQPIEDFHNEIGYKALLYPKSAVKPANI